MQATTLTEYLDRYSSCLAQQAAKQCQPLHVPGRDPILEPALLRKPFEAQAHVITGGIKALDRQRAIQISAEMGTGKGGLPTTKVLTPTGWTTLGQIKKGDRVVDPTTGGFTTVTGVFRRGVMPMFRVTFDDGASTACSGDHLWLVNTPVRKHRDQPGRVLTLDEIVSRGLSHKNGNRQHYIPLVKPPEFFPTMLPIHPYLLGYLLGNGCVSAGNSISVTIPDQETADRLAPLIVGAELRKKNGSDIDYVIRVNRGQKNPLITAMRQLGIMGCRAETKFIPHKYRFTQVDSRIALLQGLCDSDGSPDDNGTGIEYSTASKQLADDVVELVQSLGGVATRAIRPSPTYKHKGEIRTGQPSHRLYIALPELWCKPFRLSRKADKYKARTKYFPTRAIASVEPLGDHECICIAVDSKNKLYVTDDYIVTHNTLMAQAIIQGHAQHFTPGGYRALVFAPPHLVGKWEREIRDTVANAHVHHLQSYHDLTRKQRHAKPVGRGWWIVSNTRAKMGAKWEPVYIKGHIPATYDGTIRGVSRLPFTGKLYCPQCRKPIQRETKDGVITPLLVIDLERSKKECKECGSPLWQYTHQMDRWPIATYIQKHLPGWFQYCVIDESHQTKSADTAIGNAMGALVSSCGRSICLTGTLMGGYAWHVRPLLFRIAPKSLIEEGLGWKDVSAFDERYGRIERKVTETETKGKSNRESKGTTSKVVKYVRPGVMPTLFGRHLIHNTIFLSLDEVADNLPRLDEEVINVDMDVEMAVAYQRLEEELTAEVQNMLRRKDKRMLSVMLHALLGYPDHPYGWGEIGYWEFDGEGNKEWKTVTEPPDLAKDVLRAKEKALLDLVQSQWREGRKCWVGCTMTDAKDVVSRLERILAGAGLRTAVLRSEVPPLEREAWIAQHGPNIDVAISHPQLVETGLDFFAKDRSYNFPSIIFYSTGYNLFTLRQFAGRHWRIGQWEDCKTFYLHYANTMQARAMTLMGKKLAASASIEGKFSAEGLAALAGDEGSLEVALAKSLVERLDDMDVGRVWEKLSTGPRKPVAAAAPPIIVPTPEPEPQPSPEPWVAPKATNQKPVDRRVSVKQLSLF